MAPAPFQKNLSKDLSPSFFSGIKKLFKEETTALLAGTLILVLLSSGFVVYKQQKIILNQNTILKEYNNDLESLLFDKAISEGLLGSSKEKIKALDLSLQKKNEELTKVNADLEQSKKELEKTQSELAKKLAEIKSQEEKIKKQEAQLSANAKELETLRKRPPLFAFRKLTSRDVEADKKAVQALVEDAYDEIEGIFSAPYLLHQITISFVDSFSRETAVGETYISNGPEGLEIDIRLKSFNKDSFESVNTVIHELVHGFHGLAILIPLPYEEGIAVATADLVMDRLQSRGKISISERFLEHKINPFSIQIPLDTEAFYSSKNVYTYYQAVGEVWWQIEKNFPGTIKKFNEVWYKKIQAGETSTQSLIKNTLAEVCGTCQLVP